jgi:hypothetical protein
MTKNSGKEIFQKSPVSVSGAGGEGRGIRRETGGGGERKAAREERAGRRGETYI